VNYLVDTCVISELVKPRANARVVRWLRARTEATLFLSVLTLGEVQKGVEKLVKGRRRAAIEQWLDEDLHARFEGRVLDVTVEVARLWGKIQGRTEREGRIVPAIDALIAATAMTHEMTVVTRNESDIARAGAHVFDPWAP